MYFLRSLTRGGASVVRRIVNSHVEDNDRLQAEQRARNRMRESGGENLKGGIHGRCISAYLRCKLKTSGTDGKPNDVLRVDHDDAQPLPLRKLRPRTSTGPKNIIDSLLDIIRAIKDHTFVLALGAPTPILCRPS